MLVVSVSGSVVEAAAAPTLQPNLGDCRCSCSANLSSTSSFFSKHILPTEHTKRALHDVTDVLGQFLCVQQPTHRLDLPLHNCRAAVGRIQNSRHQYRPETRMTSVVVTLCSTTISPLVLAYSLCKSEFSSKFSPVPPWKMTDVAPLVSANTTRTRYERISNFN